MPKDYLQHLSTQLQKGKLPGQKAQLTMAHSLRGDLPEAAIDHRRAAVLALFFTAETGALHLIYIVRTSHDPRDRHAGQIAFPGGSVEPADVDLAATALRETEEEIGIPAGDIEILGELTDLYIPVSNFLVTPFVGYTGRRPNYTLQKSEVAEVLEIPLAEFLAPDARQTTSITLSSGFKLKDTPYWAVGGRKIWGATSMITAEIVALLAD